MLRFSLLAAMAWVAASQSGEGELATFGTTVVIPGGLTGKVYDIPEGSDRLPRFEKLEPRGTIYAKGLYIPPRDFTEGFPGITNRIEWFALDFTGRFYISNPGTYRFILCSDDGSRLYFDGKQAINNDGIHGNQCEEHPVKLEGGIHTLRLSYFQGPRFHLSLMLGVQGPSDLKYRAFNTDEFQPPANPADWKYGSPNDLPPEPADPDLGRRRLRDVVAAENPLLSVPVEVTARDRAVRNLKAGDFLLRDSGEPQTLASAAFGEQPLDIVLLLDTGAEMKPYLERIQSGAMRALSALGRNDRVAVVGFGEKLLLTQDLAMNHEMIAAAIHKVETGTGSKDLNAAIALSAQYLRERARPEADAAIVIVTGNQGPRKITDRVTRDALWNAGAIVTALIAKDPPAASVREADVRPFAAATGGAVIEIDPTHIPLAEVFQRLRERYTLRYRAPAALPKTIRTLTVELTGAAKARNPEAVVKVRGGYVVKDPAHTP